MHALVVRSHPRTTSLTVAVAERITDRLIEEGYTVDPLDLHGEGFDPVLPPEDEPDREDPNKRYTLETREHMARVAAADLIVVVFPVWWFSLPAMAKGWIDRVWNRGFAYEPSTLHGKRMLWVGLAGGSARSYAEHGFDRSLEVQLGDGISRFCGISDTLVHLMYDSLGFPDLDSVDRSLDRMLVREPAERLPVS
ncbi:NAD(P)H oxidoreductase [Nocardiopsis alba]|uniref:NAD(P)H oxidoreductase n=1 Tax=Nocardiopsis alba TaxID=53437 RepID=UPI0033A1EE5F